MNTTLRWALYGALIGAGTGLLGWIPWLLLAPTDPWVTLVALVAPIALTLAGQIIGGNLGLRKEFPE